MSNNLTDINAKNLSELAYLADKLGKIDTTQYANLGKVFFDENNDIRQEIAQDENLNAFAQKVQANESAYRDMLDNCKLVGTSQ